VTRRQLELHRLLGAVSTSLGEGCCNSLLKVYINQPASRSIRALSKRENVSKASHLGAGPGRSISTVLREIFRGDDSEIELGPGGHLRVLGLS